MVTVNDILQDIVSLSKIFCYHIYTLLEILVRCFIPFNHLKKSIRGNNVLITGAAGGVGTELVKRFLRLGCNVVCIDINESMLDNLKAELNNEFDSESNSIKKRVHFYILDVTDSDMVKKVACQIKSEVGKIDILINNAGIMNQGKMFLDLTEKDVKKIFGVNTFAHFWLCREFLPDMIHDNKGHIVNVASVCGIFGSYKLTDYCSSKFAALGFTESLRSEVRVANSSSKLTISAVCPFHIKTKMFNGAEILYLKWMNLSMTPEYAADAIVEGVLLDKELIFIPQSTVFVFAIIKYLLPTKCADYMVTCLDLNGSIDRYKKID